MTRAFKTCPTCKSDKPAERFSRHKNRSDGLQSVCKDCELIFRRKTQRRSDLKRNYNLTPEQYDEILAAQGGGCAICGSTSELRMDHDHDCCPSVDGKNARACGKCNRGILCNSCNVTLGKYDDDPDALAAQGLAAASNYLLRERVAA